MLEGGGNALYDLKRYEEALAASEQAIRLDPSDAMAYTLKGDALRKLGKTKEAEYAFEQVRQLGSHG